MFGTRARIRLVSVWFAAALGGLGLVLLGCSKNSPTSPLEPSVGNLTVLITAPPGVLPGVTVKGPNGYNLFLTATRTLTVLVGAYTVQASSFEGSGPIVSAVYGATVSRGGTLTVGGGVSDTVTVSYAARPGTGTLWVANASGAMVGYAAAQLGTSTPAAPAITLAVAAGARPLGVAAAFDTNNTLWISDFNDNTLLAFPAILGASGSRVAAVTISASAGSLSSPAGLAVDNSRMLWVANSSNNTIVGFRSDQLGVGGSPTPFFTISASGGSLDGPEGLAFDAGGALWVANAKSNTLVKFDGGQLATGSPTPITTISANAGSLNAPVGLAFDLKGTLWVANAQGNSVVAFTSTQLISGAPTPAITLSSTAQGSLSGPTALAFDASGNLWVANGTGNTVLQFAATQLAASGAPTPKVILSGSSLSKPMGLAFNLPDAISGILAQQPPQ